MKSRKRTRDTEDPVVPRKSRRQKESNSSPPLLPEEVESSTTTIHNTRPISMSPTLDDDVESNASDDDVDEDDGDDDEGSLVPTNPGGRGKWTRPVRSIGVERNKKVKSSCCICFTLNTHGPLIFRKMNGF